LKVGTNTYDCVTEAHLAIFLLAAASADVLPHGYEDSGK